MIKILLFLALSVPNFAMSSSASQELAVTQTSSSDATPPEGFYMKINGQDRFIKIQDLKEAQKLIQEAKQKQKDFVIQLQASQIPPYKMSQLLDKWQREQWQKDEDEEQNPAVSPPASTPDAKDSELLQLEKDPSIQKLKQAFQNMQKVFLNIETHFLESGISELIDTVRAKQQASGQTQYPLTLEGIESMINDMYKAYQQASK